MPTSSDSGSLPVETSALREPLIFPVGPTNEAAGYDRGPRARGESIETG